MALGEAFINVRADLKPFTKDLEKGIKAVLKAAEARIRSDNGIGTALRDQVRTGFGSGIEQGIDEGTRRGARKAQRQLLSVGQKFFAALGDFADDGLSALPSEVKAAIVLGVAAAAIVVAPLLAGALSGAITAALSVGAIGLGAALASQFKVVDDQFRALGRTVLSELRGEAAVFIVPLQQAAVDLLDSFERLRPEIAAIFGAAAQQVEPLTRALTGFVEQLLPGIRKAIIAARPLIEALAVALPQLGRDVGKFFEILADGSPEAAVALKDLLAIFGDLIINTALIIRGLTGIYFWMRVISAGVTGDFGTAIQLIGQREQDATLASGQLRDGLGGVNTALDKTTAEANAAALAISDLIAEQFRGVNAAIDYQQATDDLRESIAAGNRDFRITEENGRTNLRLVEQAITAAARQRDTAIENAAVTGESVDKINAAYQSQITEIEKVIGKNAKQDGSLKTLITTARQVPKDVTIKVSAPDAGKTTSQLGAIERAIRNIVRAGNAVIRGKNPSGGAGLQTTLAAGAIVTQPTDALIAEAGYSEAVIPDPRVKPQRALELADQFGLSSLIASTLSGGQQVINVFVGGRQLDEQIDYRIGYNNQMQAVGMNHGPRAA